MSTLNPVFSWPLRVYYEDTDLSGVVYHANYLKFFERARTEWLRALGCSQERLRGEVQVVFTVSQINVAFRSPARLDDELEATVAVTELKRASLVLSQTLRLREQPDRLLASAEVRVASVDAASFRPTALPPLFRDRARFVADDHR
ncbi:MAG: tol-pal system-associated acyl-CoA thioesterase [Gammaproteobacteria bacterium]|jgi:acyl-CoA thioester hydrolase|nr:tol-pal system-associated acyl-CoA thioesterase [Gammaproteobacteria bacterium]